MRPKKKKKKHELPDAEVNITSLMDILTTLLFFVLMVMSLQEFSVLESTSLSASRSKAEKKPVFILQVTLKAKDEALVWLGPLKGLEEKIVDRSYLDRFLKRNFKGKWSQGFSAVAKAKDLDSTLVRVQDLLTGLKKSFPYETKAVLSLRDSIKFQSMIDAISRIREIPSDEEGYVFTNPAREKVSSRVLFPQIVIAEEKG